MSIQTYYMYKGVVSKRNALSNRTAVHALM